MNKEKVLVITDKKELYDKCENMEQLFDKYYLPLLEIHYKKTHQSQQDKQNLIKYLEDNKEGAKIEEKIIRKNKE